MSRLDPGFGLVVLEPRLSTATLAPRGLLAVESAYTESGPQPGHPVASDPNSRWRPQAQGAQSVSATARTIRGGYPGRGAGAASVIYRLASETSPADWRSWEEPNLLTDWTTPTDGWAGASWDEVTATVLPDSHKVIMVARHGTDAQTWEYDPRTEAWTSRFDFTANPGLARPIAMAYDEEGQRLILWSGDGTTAAARQQVAYYSDDGGASWNIYSRGMYDNVIDDAGGPMRVAVARGLDWLAILPTATGLDQYASSDRGVSWQRVQSGLSGTLHYPLRTSTGWLVAYARTADGFLCIRQIGSPRSSFSNAAEQLVYSFATQNVVGVRDYDGALYLYHTSTGGNTAVLVSYDDGTTWAEYESVSGTREYAISSAAVQPSWNVAVPAAGSVFCVGLHESLTKIHVCRFGGYSNVEQGSRGTGGGLRTGPYRFGSGSAGSTSDYIALEFPDTYTGWTRLVGAGTRSMAGTDIGLQVSCTQAQVERYQGGTLAGDWAAGAFAVRVSAGQNRGGTAPTFNSGLCWELVLDTGVNRYVAYIEIGADGLRTHDGGTQRSDTALTMSTWTHVRYYLRPGGLTVWYRQVGTNKWTRIANDVTLTAGATAAAGTSATWGHLAAAVAGTTTWHTRYVYHASEGAWRHRLDGITETDDAYISGVLGLVYGRRLPGRGAAYPCPDLTSTSEDMGSLSAVGGPTYWGEETSLPVAYTYGVGNVHPGEVPSPRRPWRATDTSEVRFVWDNGSAMWRGGAVALVVLGASPREFVLEQDNGAGVFTTLTTLDKGWSTLGYSLTGSVVVPAFAATLPRYFHEGELVGGYFIFPTAGTPVARRIVRQSAGFWTASTSVQQIRLEVEGLTGVEFASNSGDLVHHSGFVVAYPSADTARQFLRVRIASGANVPGGYYEAGLVGVGRVLAAPTPAWDYSVVTELSRRTRRNAEGGLEVVQTGPPRKVVEYRWPHGVSLQELRQLSEAPDYYAASGGVPIGSESDVFSSPLGVIEHQMRSGEVPAVVVPRLPAAGVTITDPSLFYYGRLLSDAVGLSNVVGTEGVSEVLRVDSLAFEQIR